MCKTKRFETDNYSKSVHRNAKPYKRAKYKKNWDHDEQ